MAVEPVEHIQHIVGEVDTFGDASREACGIAQDQGPDLGTKTLKFGDHRRVSFNNLVGL